MGTDSKIEWTDHTFNPWLGCTEISPGCDHCYAESWSKRSGLVKWGKHARRRTSDTYWRAPFVWNNKAAEFERTHGRRQRIFCASLADIFDNQANSKWRSDLFELIRACDRLDWLLLTKRPQNIAKMLPRDWGVGYLNVWLGITAEDQKHYDERWHHLSKITCAVTFECEWNTVKAIANFKTEGHKIELFYFLASGWLDRSLAGTTKNIAQLEKWWGNSSWRQLQGMNGHNRALLMARRFCDDLNYSHCYAWPIYDRGSGGRVMYHMIHATDHDEAPKLMNRAYFNATRAREPLRQLQMELDELWNVPSVARDNVPTNK